MLDTYWSDHCRHTTFLTAIDNVEIEDEAAKKAYERYVNNAKKPGATSKDCIGCGFCESKCPQKLSIRDLLKKVEPILEAL